MIKLETKLNENNKRKITNNENGIRLNNEDDREERGKRLLVKSREVARDRAPVNKA